MRLEDLVVEVRDRTLNRLGTILPEDMDIEVLPTHNNIGSWKVTLPTDHAMAAVLKEPGSGMIFTGPTDVLSGPTIQPETTATLDDVAGTVTFSGVGDTIILSDALAWPQPSNGDPGTQTLSHDERTGAAETVMHAYVNANIGPSAPATRRKNSLAMGVDGARGQVVTKQARFPELGNLLAEIAAPSSLGFRVVQRQAGLAFETYSVTDRTAMIRLSITNGELASQKVTTAAPAVTRVIVAGTGQLVGRKFIERTNDAAIAAEEAYGRRIERFLDSRSTDQTTALNQAGDEVLAQDGGTVSAINAVPTDDSEMEFGVDWYLGDTISVEIDGLETPVTAIGAILKADSDGLRIGVQLGDSGGTTAAAAPRSIAGLDVRVSNLERNTAAEEEGPGSATTNSGGNHTTVAGTTGYVTPTGLAETVFTAPPSGRVLVMTISYLKSNADGTLVGQCPEVRAGNIIRSGSLVLAANIDNTAMNANVQFIRTQVTAFVDGLTPGLEYNAYMAVYRASAGALVNNTHIQIIPL